MWKTSTTECSFFSKICHVQTFNHQIPWNASLLATKLRDLSLIERFFLPLIPAEMKDTTLVRYAMISMCLFLPPCVSVWQLRPWSLGRDGTVTYCSASACNNAANTCIWNQKKFGRENLSPRSHTSCFQIDTQVSIGCDRAANQSLPESPRELSASWIFLHQLSTALLKTVWQDSHTPLLSELSLLCVAIALRHPHVYSSFMFHVRRMWRVRDCRPERCQTTINGWLRSPVNHQGLTGQVSHSGSKVTG